MSKFFNAAQIRGILTGKYPCPECGTLMEWEDEYEETLVCPNCGYDCDSDHYGLSDEEYDAQYPTKEEVCGEDEEGDDEFEGYGDE